MRLMQFLGIFPYVWPNSPPDASARLSVALCLWVVLLQLFYLGVSYLKLVAQFAEEQEKNLGELLQQCIDVFCLFSSNVIEFLMIIQSRRLANLLPRLEEAFDEAVKLRMNSWITSNVKAFSIAVGVASLSQSVVIVYLDYRGEPYMIPSEFMKETTTRLMYALQMGFLVMVLHFLSSFVNHLARESVTLTQTVELQAWCTSAQVKDEASCQQQMNRLFYLEHRLRKVSVIITYFRHGVRNPLSDFLAALIMTLWASQPSRDHHNVSITHKDMLQYTLYDACGQKHRGNGKYFNNLPLLLQLYLIHFSIN